MSRRSRSSASLSRGPVLVTGGAGFIGERVVVGLLAEGRRVVALDDHSAGTPGRLPREAEGLVVVRADVGRPGVLEDLLRREGPLASVLHLAARVGVRRVLADPEACRRENLRGVRRLVAALAGLDPRERPRLFAASTSEVYRERRRPLREGDALRSVHGAGRWAYAASKLAGERLLDAAAGLWPAGAGPVHLRFFNVVGPGQDAGGGMVLPTFVEQALGGEALTVHGDGAQVRTLAHVDDVAADLCRMLSLPDFPAGPVNLGGRARCSVLELARLVLEEARAAAASTAGIALVDPREHCSRDFEDVSEREPSLARARGLGLGLRSRSVRAIVHDTTLRHASLRRRYARTAQAAGLGAGTATEGAARRIACASLAS